MGSGTCEPRRTGEIEGKRESEEERRKEEKKPKSKGRIAKHQETSEQNEIETKVADLRCNRHYFTFDNATLSSCIIGF